MVTTLYFIEDWPVSEDLLQTWAHTEGALLVTLNSRTSYELTKRGISFKRADEFYTYRDYERLGEENFHNVLDFVHFIDHQLSSIDTIRQARLGLAESNYYSLKILFDSVFLAAFEIMHVIQTTRPKHIHFHGWPVLHTNTEIPFTNQETLYGRIVSIVARSYGIQVTESAQISPSLPNITFTPAIFKQRLLKLLQACMPQVMQTKHLLRPVLVPHLLRSLRPTLKEAVFFINPAYDVDELAQTMIRQGIGPLYHIDISAERITRFFPLFSWQTVKRSSQPALRKAIQQTGSRLLQEDALLKYFDFDGIQLLDSVKHKIDWFFSNLFPDALETYLAYYDYFAHFPGAQLVMSTTADSAKEMVLCAARHRGLRTYKYQHGSDGFFHFPILEYRDLKNAHAFFIYGEGVKKGLQKHFNQPIDLIPVGSGSLDNLESHPPRARLNRLLDQRKIDRSRPIVVYPLSMMTLNHMFISYNFYRDWDYFQIHCKVVDVFRDHPEIQLIIKSHPNVLYPESPVSQYIHDKNIANCHVIREASFTDFFPYADMFIIDIASTIILQAMTTSKKIFVYNGVLHFEPEARDLVMKRCVYHENLSQFLEDLDQTLTTRDFKKVYTDRDFLKAYGTYLDNGRSSQRALAALMQRTLPENSISSGRGMRIPFANESAKRTELRVS